MKKYRAGSLTRINKLEVTGIKGDMITFISPSGQSCIEPRWTDFHSWWNTLEEAKNALIIRNIKKAEYYGALGNESISEHYASIVEKIRSNKYLNLEEV